ncbi:protein GAMETE EXPRESSED 1-like isoform X2 [Apium graveolens]|uniref:protein GAMETE EXPRESSED 1-like isoform X2 n=1 Tax=Apium graveolens TaxID=4045 RepID=UPI003D7B9C38
MGQVISWLLLFMILHAQYCLSLDWYFSWKNAADSKGVVSKFSGEPLHSHKGVELLKSAKQMSVSSNSCWQNAYQNLLARCSEILAAEEYRSRLAWYLSDCFQKDSGRSPFPHCDWESSMKTCLQKLDVDARDIYLEFYVETNSICHQIQADTFKRNMERLVTELKMASEIAESKIEDIQDQAEHLITSSKKTQESLVSIDSHSDQLAQTSKKVEDEAGFIVKQMEAVHEQCIGMTSFQLEFLKRQGNMKESTVEGIELLHNSFNNLNLEVDKFELEALEIENAIGKMDDEMSSKMKYLQNKADNIGHITAISIGVQSELLEGQSDALKGVQHMSNFMTQALEDSRRTTKKLSEIGHKQQEELFRRQEQLKQTHAHLIQNSRTILAAQEDFESKQSAMFLAIDKLFALHNPILLESSPIKAFLAYSLSIFIIFMFTSMKQTYCVRPRLYIGLCAAFLFECFVPKYLTETMKHSTTRFF